LQKVKLLCTGAQDPLTTESCTGAPIFNQGLPEKFQSGSAENFSIKVRLKISNRSLIDPDHHFNRDRDRDYKMKIANRFENQNRDPILISKSRIDFRTKIGSRSYAPSVLLFIKPVFNR